jgi:hypothetical protein
LPMSIRTCAVVCPFCTVTTFPWIWLRALSFMMGLLDANGLAKSCVPPECLERGSDEDQPEKQIEKFRRGRAGERARCRPDKACRVTVSVPAPSCALLRSGYNAAQTGMAIAIAVFLGPSGWVSGLDPAIVVPDTPRPAQERVGTGSGPVTAILGRRI